MHLREPPSARAKKQYATARGPVPLRLPQKSLSKIQESGGRGHDAWVTCGLGLSDFRLRWGEVTGAPCLEPPSPPKRAPVTRPPKRTLEHPRMQWRGEARRGGGCFRWQNGGKEGGGGGVGSPKTPKCLENGLFCDQKWVKNGPKMGLNVFFQK